MAPPSSRQESDCSVAPGLIVRPRPYRPIVDGTGYPLRRRRDGSVVQTAPDECPNGHPLHYPNVIVSFSPTKHMIGWLCLTCGMKVWRDGSVSQEAIPAKP